MRIAILAILLTILSAASAHAQCVTTSDPALDDVGQTLHGWQRYDQDVVRDGNGDVARWATAKANASAIATDWHLMFHPNGMEMVQAIAQIPVLGVILAPALIPAAWVGDVMEVVGGPFAIVKDTADTATWGVLSIFRRDGALPPKRSPAR